MHIFINTRGFGMLSDPVQNPVSMKVLQTEKSLQHVSFNVSKSEHNAGVFDDDLYKYKG